jgi:hypothetical protein
MLKRRRFKQTLNLSERLIEDIELLKAQLAKLAPGPERDQVIRRIRRNETASHIDEWLRSPGLQPPSGLSSSAK